MKRHSCGHKHSSLAGAKYAFRVAFVALGLTVGAVAAVSFIITAPVFVSPAYACGGGGGDGGGGGGGGGGGDGGDGGDGDAGSVGDPSSAPIGFGPSNVKIDSSGVPKSKKKGPRLQTVIGIINRLGESTKDPRRSFRPLQGRGSGSRPVMPPPWDGTGGYPSGYRANATSTPTSSTGAPSSPIGITEGTHTLECSGCIAWGGRTSNPVFRRARLTKRPFKSSRSQKPVPSGA